MRPDHWSNLARGRAWALGLACGLLTVIISAGDAGVDRDAVHENAGSIVERVQQRSRERKRKRDTEFSPPTLPLEAEQPPADKKQMAPAEAPAKPGVVPSAPVLPEEKTVWSDEEIKAALQDCIRLLGPAVVELEVEAPIRAGACGAPALVLLKRVGPAPGVEMRPAMTVNCAVAARTAEWIDKVVQPAARDLLGSTVAALSGTSGYQCRFRNNAIAGKMSEHAFANAMDVLGFVLADGRRVDVLAHWGPTGRDIEAAAGAAAGGGEKPEPRENGDNGAAEATSKAKPAKDSPRTRKEKEKRKKRVQEPKAEEDGAPEPVEPVSKGKGGRDRKGREDRVPVAATVPDPAEKAFLLRVHKGSCGMFTTVLGPEANEAHRDHFHLDLAARKRRAYCQ